MNITLKQISNMKKIRSAADLNCDEVLQITALAGQRVNYQICLVCDERMNAGITVDSELSDSLKLFSVKSVIMDRPVTHEDLVPEEEDYISYEPGLMPDLLVPISAQNGRTYIGNGNLNLLWVRVDVPTDCKPGSYQVNIHYHIAPGFSKEATEKVSKTMMLEVIPAILPEQTLIYTRWLHVDCIADYHHVEVYSEAHWALIEQYIATAMDTGINMILVPVHTPPLDTAIGLRRTCVQLVDIEKRGDRYEFNFEKFHRFLSICKKCGVKYYEIAHMFSQWGAKCTPNIMVTENGVKDYLFGWHVSADSELYINFLKQYIEAISAQLEVEGIAECTYFHISDEPTLESMETYKTASNLIRPFLKGSKTLDALSNVEFYDHGLVECPVTAVDHMEHFLERDVPNQWVYYCTGQQIGVTNSLLANPSYRTRILGFQMYRHDVKGFLQWGYNFYNSPASMYQVDPYSSTSADGFWPSGDPFIVYPAPDGAYSSLRAEVFYEALQDMRICQLLEAKIGRAAVVQVIDDAAGYVLTFEHYPRGEAWQDDLRNAMLQRICC